MSKKLELKSVYEILDYGFFIPSYQRGYRWEEQQIKDLLNDIYEFACERQSDFYCLQPIVVKKDGEKKYRVIDGQQRLTTIYIVLKYLEEAREIVFSDTRIFPLEYETRERSEEFLQNSLKKGIDESNPDFYYMSKAYQTIKRWFAENKVNKADFLNALLRYKKDECGNDTAKNVRFIWYELPQKEDEIKVFTRLNIGKIPLSNSELIKALFLDNLEEYEKFEIVSEWDFIEKNLQDDRFFAFLTKKRYANTRIDFIFDLIAKRYDKAYGFSFKKDERFSFYVFEKLIKEKSKDKKELWREVKQYFRIFEELFNDNIYYHYVGFLTNSGVDIDTIVEDFKKNLKNVFKKKLEERMQIELKTPLEKLEYETDGKIIEKLLFLFNVLITMQSHYARYPFDLHNKEQWSLEHIHAQHSEGLKEHQKKELLQHQLESEYVDEKVKKKIKKLLEDFDESRFLEVQKKIFEKFTDDNDTVHTIDNLALLSKADNSSLNNAIFPQKRKRIKELDEKGKFIPLGTKNVFMKYYSDKVDEFLRWNSSDRAHYLKVLQDTLTPFIKVGK